MSDPLKDLAPFLEQARKSSEQILPPEFLTVRLMNTRTQGLEPAVSPLPEEAALPREFGPYVLESVLGRGAGGTVYRGYDAELERTIALKVLSSSLSSAQETEVRFLREARAMAKLSDDNLMPLLAVHQNTPAPCFSMPLLEGETLQDRIERTGPLSVDEGVELAIQVSKGLATAHEAGLVHRDLKPSNIFLEKTEEGTRARLMDFGLVKAEEEADFTREGELAGTPAFMAPEQIDGVNIDGRADLYSLGVTLFMVLSGRPPFEGKTLTATLRQVSVEEAPRLEDKIDNLPAWFSQLVSDLLEKNPEDRPANARLVVQRIKEKKVRATAVGLKSQRMLFVGAGVAAVLIGLGLWSLPVWQKGKTEVEEFDAAVALRSLKSGDEWKFPAGTHYLESMDLGGKDLKIEGHAEGTRLIFVNLSGPAFRNVGQFDLKNLTIDCSRGGGSESSPLVHSVGQRIAISNCRIEQQSSQQGFPDDRSLIEAPAGSVTTILSSEVYAFRAIVWKMTGDSELRVEDSLIVSPGLVYHSTEEKSVGEVTVRNSTCMHQVGISSLVDSSDLTAPRMTFEDSIVECSHALVWLPMGDEEVLKEGLQLEMNRVLLLTGKNLINSSARPRVISRRAGTVDSWVPVRWLRFWGESHQDVSIRKGTMIDRSLAVGERAKNLSVNSFAIPLGFEKLGADLTKVGPSLLASK